MPSEVYDHVVRNRFGHRRAARLRTVAFRMVDRARAATNRLTTESPTCPAPFRPPPPAGSAVELPKTLRCGKTQRQGERLSTCGRGEVMRVPWVCRRPPAVLGPGRRVVVETGTFGAIRRCM